MFVDEFITVVVWGWAAEDSPLPRNGEWPALDGTRLASAKTLNFQHPRVSYIGYCRLHSAARACLGALYIAMEFKIAMRCAICYQMLRPEDGWKGEEEGKRELTRSAWYERCLAS